MLDKYEKLEKMQSLEKEVLDKMQQRLLPSGATTSRGISANVTNFKSDLVGRVRLDEGQLSNMRMTLPERKQKETSGGGFTKASGRR